MIIKNFTTGYFFCTFIIGKIIKLHSGIFKSGCFIVIKINQNLSIYICCALILLGIWGVQKTAAKENGKE